MSNSHLLSRTQAVAAEPGSQGHWIARPCAVGHLLPSTASAGNSDDTSLFALARVNRGERRRDMDRAR